MKRTPKQPRRQLYDKLFELMKAIPTLERTGQMKSEGSEETAYSYNEAQATKAAFREEFLRLRLMCMPKDLDVIHWGNATATGGTLNYSQQVFTFEFTDIDTGYSELFKYSGEGADALDKGSPKAAIQALKYFWLNSFCVECITPLDGDSADEQDKGKEFIRQYLDKEGLLETWRHAEDIGKTWLQVDGFRMWVAGKGIGKRALQSAVEKKVKVRYFIGKLSPWETAVPLATELVICGAPEDTSEADRTKTQSLD